MRVRTRKKISPIHIVPGDSIRLSYEEVVVGPLGKVVGVIKEQEVLKSKIERSMVVDEALIFDVEAGDFPDAEDGIGGAFIKRKE